MIEKVDIARDGRFKFNLLQHGLLGNSSPKMPEKVWKRNRGMVDGPSLKIQDKTKLILLAKKRKFMEKQNRGLQSDVDLIYLQRALKEDKLFVLRN